MRGVRNLFSGFTGWGRNQNDYSLPTSNQDINKDNEEDEKEDKSKPISEFSKPILSMEKELSKERKEEKSEILEKKDDKLNSLIKKKEENVKEEEKEDVKEEEKEAHNSPTVHPPASHHNSNKNTIRQINELPITKEAKEGIQGKNLIRILNR